MGCSSSKSAETQEQSRQSNIEDKENGELIELTTEKAVSYLCSHFGIDEERSAKIVATINRHNEDDKQDELLSVWTALKAKKDELTPLFEKHDPEKTGCVNEANAIDVLTSAYSKAADTGLRDIIKRYFADAGTDGEDGVRSLCYQRLVFVFAHMHARKTDLENKLKALDDEDGMINADDAYKVLIDEYAFDDVMSRSLVDDFGLKKENKLKKQDLIDVWLTLCS